MTGRDVIRYLTAATVMVLAVVAGVLSYRALHDLAVAQQIPGDFSWLWPIAVDATLIAGGFVVLYDELDRQPTTVGWLIVLAGTGFSVLVQALQTPQSSALGMLVRGLPPASLAVGWWLLMRMVRRRLAPAGSRSVTRSRTGSRDRPAPDFGRGAGRSRDGARTVGAGPVGGPADGRGPTGRIDPSGLSEPPVGHVSGRVDGRTGGPAGPVTGAAQWPQAGPRVGVGSDLGVRADGGGKTLERVRRLVAANAAAGRDTSGRMVAEALNAAGIQCSERHGRRLLGRALDGWPRLEVVGE